jgi:alpha-1,2-mannosyltransferase
VFGVDAWQRWLDFAIGNFAAADAKWVEYGRMWGDSVYACVVAGTASQTLANSAQAAAILFAASATYRAFRLPLPFNHKIAVALAGTILAAPHSSLPDALLLAIAALLWISQSSADGASIWRWPLALCLWLIPFLNPPLISPIGRFSPLLVIALIGVLISNRKNSWATREATPA